jgi:hypothetical protein
VKRFAAWTTIILGVMVVAHSVVLMFGGPAAFGSRPSALFPSASFAHGESVLLGNLGAILVPLAVGALTVAVGARMLRAPHRRQRKHGENEEA